MKTTVNLAFSCSLAPRFPKVGRTIFPHNSSQFLTSPHPSCQRSCHRDRRAEFSTGRLCTLFPQVSHRRKSNLNPTDHFPGSVRPLPQNDPGHFRRDERRDGMGLHGNRFASAAEQLIDSLYIEESIRPDMYLRIGLATVALALLAVASEIRVYGKPTPNGKNSRKRSTRAAARAVAILAPWVALIF